MTEHTVVVVVVKVSVAVAVMMRTYSNFSIWGGFVYLCALTRECSMVQVQVRENERERREVI